MKNVSIREKQKNTILEKYGVEHISQLDKIKEHKKEKSLEKYGTEFVLQSVEVKKKSKETNIIKYGVENPQQNISIQKKTENTNIIKYGVKCYFSSEEFKDTTIQTNLVKYGVPHHSQNAQVADTMLKSSYNKNPYKMPSGKIIEYQGYEHFAFDELLIQEKINEDDIITDRKCVPEIWYYDETNKKHRHYVDIYIKSQNRCIEVKSTWTNTQKKNNVLAKQKAAQDLGFKYEIWIYDNNGNKIT